VDQQTMDKMKDTISQINSAGSDWKSKLEGVHGLFDFSDQNQHLLVKTTKFIEIIDTVCKLMNDSN
jgi:hypothetical protein